MTHAYSYPVPFHADPVLAAIERHAEAWQVFQVAPQGEALRVADDEMRGSLEALLGTPCATRAGMLCLIRHLRWWLEQEHEYAVEYQPAYGIAQAREADLSKLLGVEPIQRLPIALPSGRLSGPVIDMRPIEPEPIKAEPVRAPALIRSPRPLAIAADAVTALAIVIGGMGLTGFASLL